MYTLYNGASRLFDFEMKETKYGNRYKIIKSHDENKSLYPATIKGLGLTEDALQTWLNSRIAPTGRHHLEKVLSAINIQNKFYVLMYSHAMSLNDAYWIKTDNENISFDDINLYDNPFDTALGWIAFTGIKSDISKTLSTPETTTGGMLAKYWERDKNGKIKLIKGGTRGYANAGGEPFSEVAASIIADIININHLTYTLGYKKHNDEILPISVSDLFTNKKYGLRTGSEYITEHFPHRKTVFLEEVINKLKSEEIDIKPFYDMCFFDWLIKNEDRHLNNWGFLVDNDTQDIISFAPVWDNGASLLYSAMLMDFDNGRENADEYTREPVFSSFRASYNFIFDCEYRDDYIRKCNILLKEVKNGNLNKLLDKAYPDVEWAKKHIWKKEYVISMLEERCNFYLSYSIEKVPENSIKNLVKKAEAKLEQDKITAIKKKNMDIDL